MATCAICMQPISTGSKFVLSDTEVMHRTCALGGGKTVLAKARQAHADLHVTVERAQRAAEHAAKTAAELQGRLEVSVGANSALGNALLAMKRERDVAIQERDLARTARGNAHVPVVVTPTVQEVVDDPPQDDAAVRFSLLEFDSV